MGALGEAIKTKDDYSAVARAAKDLCTRHKSASASEFNRATEEFGNGFRLQVPFRFRFRFDFDFDFDSNADKNGLFTLMQESYPETA